ncbi:hypothetical protein K493DRAFT_307822 [Basidiobolus meristosporus CBS 931.73]|uniref:Uncharacterized protein n=1 Tax=Basidiobolus meristosporus CBS 931.73 TaxID=1314790 RepID=A0A1Y1X9K1_9FUNG|nr:hypothetical protein K493DRAFT_307822 [Basidiobolus meristosporus CBS 931.73]|eukprot:ORX82451.1 hypothetical protein K493DRAFT_307822 [Basidiobolus meristosporus CBS 931.73]
MVTTSPLLCFLLAATLSAVQGQILVEPVVFPAQFESRSDAFFEGTRVRANAIKEIAQAKNDLRIKNIDLIPAELLRDKNQLNYIASLSINNKEAYKNDEWQENYDTNPEGCRIYGQFRKQVQRCSNAFIAKNLFRDNSRNAGFRYAYACTNTIEISCPRSGCKYDPTKPVYNSNNKPIFVKEANIMKPDGKGVEEDIEFADDKDEIILFPGTRTMTLRECHSRQIYFATQVMIGGSKKDGYFAQSENAESQVGYSGDSEVRVQRAWFVYLS